MVTSIAAALNWDGNAMIGGREGSPTALIVCSTLGRQHQLEAQCRAVLAFNHPLDELCDWVFHGFLQILLKNDFVNQKKSERNEIMIAGYTNSYFIKQF